MKQRKLRRIRVRHWDSVHKSWDAVLDHDYMWPARYIKACKKYSAWCSDCNLARFKADLGRFPHNVEEFNASEDKAQAEEP